MQAEQEKNGLLELVVYFNVKKTRAVPLFQGCFRACSDRLFESDIRTFDQVDRYEKCQ